MRKSLLITPLAVVLVVVSAVSLFAHHGGASFDTGKEVKLEGKVAEWLWANPHCFLKVEVKGENGEVRTWNLELGNPTDITARGYRRNTFKPGDQVSFVAQPVKNGTPVGRLRSVMLADGRTF